MSNFRKDGLPKCPPPILTKCPHPRKNRTLYGILLIRTYNGNFFLKTPLKLEEKYPKRPLPHDPLVENQFYTCISDFFFTKNGKCHFHSLLNIRHFSTFYHFLCPIHQLKSTFFIKNQNRKEWKNWKD